MRSLKIAGIERIADLVQSTLNIQRALTYLVDTCTFDVSGVSPSEGEEVIVEQDGTRLFGGIIVKVELAWTFDNKSTKVWKIDCDDYTALLDRKLVVETYEGQAADNIFIDVANKYCPGFTASGVRTGAPVVEYMVFNDIRPSECFKQLCEYIGWHWMPDYYKDLQFFSAEELASPAPMALQPGGKFRFGKHSIDMQGLRNQVKVKGGTMLSGFLSVEWKADGVARIWTLPFKPHEITYGGESGKIGVGGIAKTVGIENVDDESTKDYLLNPQEGYIKASAGTATPADGATISFNAKQDMDVITIVDDSDSQAAIAAVQGGDGIYQHVIVDDSLTTIEAAEAAANADLRNYANPAVKGDFSTEIDGWSPGQLITINLPDRGVTGTFLIQKVTITTASRDILTYKIEYGGRLLGIADYLKAIVSAQQKKKLNNTEQIRTFKNSIEVAALSDTHDHVNRTPIGWRVGQRRAENGGALGTSDEVYFIGNSMIVDLTETRPVCGFVVCSADV
ncbi:MAG: hypothetical protein HGA27_00245 [Peptococcaceae bacterium]|nr:hypothetical protein [Peptococcaceae bacterium]